MEKLKILIVDDFPDNVFLLEEIITNLGFEADSVSNGEQAVDAVRTGNYQLVFMDIEMPVMNGFEAAEEIRELPEPKNEILIIAISAHSQEFFAEKVHRTGINDYISKPYTFQKIVTVLKRNGICL